MYVSIDKDTTIRLDNVVAILDSGKQKKTRTAIIDAAGHRILTNKTARLIAKRIEQYGKKG